METHRDTTAGRGHANGEGRSAAGIVRRASLIAFCLGFGLAVLVSAPGILAATTSTDTTPTRTVTRSETVTQPPRTVTETHTITERHTTSVTNNTTKVQPATTPTSGKSGGGGLEWWGWVLIALGALAAALAMFLLGRQKGAKEATPGYPPTEAPRGYPPTEPPRGYPPTQPPPGYPPDEPPSYPPDEPPTRRY
jgi:hypothetical protein